MDITCTYQTPRRLCDVISPFVEKECGKLTKRPWNRFKPDVTSWWLVPGTGIPHFKHGKYYFNWADKNRETLLAGLYAEKGLDEELGVAYSSKKAKNFIMTPNWNWFRFLEGIKTRQLFENLKTGYHSPAPIEFIINGGYVTEPTSFDPYQEKNLGWDQYSFTWNAENDALSLSSVNRKAFVLKLHHVKSVDDLAESILQYAEDKWLWLNIHIAIRLTIDPAAKDSEETWTDEQIWNNFLLPLKNWIK